MRSNFFWASFISVAPIFASNSCCLSIFAISSLDIPNAWASDSACIRLRSKNPAADPTWLVISVAAPAKSLFKNSSLALFKFIFLPVNNWASNSFDIEDSKFKKEFAIESSCFNSKPKAFVVTRDLVNFSGYLANCKPSTPPKFDASAIIFW